MAAGSIKQRPNGRWSVRWRLKDGTHRRKTFTQKRDAERFLREAIVDVERGVFPGAKRGETIASLIAEWWASIDDTTVKPRTVERYDLHRRVILERVGLTPLDMVGFQFAQGFINELRDAGLAPRTIRATYGVFALAMTYGVNQGKLIPFNKPKLPQIPDGNLTIPSREEVELLAASVDARLCAMVLLAGYCGLREGELLGMELRNVRLEEHRVWINQAMNKSSRQIETTKTKGSKRWVVLPERTLTALEEHMAEFPGERVFPITGSAAQKAWERGRVLAGLPTVRFHDLRHAAASMMIAAGWNIMQVSRQLGHSQPSMTLNTYGFLYPESFVDAIAKLDAYIAHDATPPSSAVPSDSSPQ